MQYPKSGKNVDEINEDKSENPIGTGGKWSELILGRQ